MNELHDSGERVVRGPAITQRARRQQNQCWAQALATTTDDVFGHLADENHLRVQAFANLLIHGVHVGSEQLA